MKNWKIQNKIFFIIFVMAFFLIASCSVALYYNGKANTLMKQMYSNRLLSIKNLNDIWTNTSAMEQLTIELIDTPSDDKTTAAITQEINDRVKQNDISMSAYTPLATDPYEKESLPQAMEYFQTSRTERQKTMELVQAGQKDEAYAYYMKNVAPVVNKFNNALNGLTQYNTDAAQKEFAQNQADNTKTSVFLGVLTVVGIIVSFGLGFIISHMIAKPIAKLAAAAGEVAQGDLTRKGLKITNKDEIGEFVQAFRAMNNNLREMVQQVALTSEQVASSSEELTAITEESAATTTQIASSVSDVANRAQVQAQAAGETSAAVEQISASIQQIAASSERVSDMTEDALKKAVEGKDRVDKATNQMNQIGVGTKEVEHLINKLDNSSKEISEITTTITGIAEQTNLLALNAAIEAARAGEQGRGFVVVAEEVRKLAEQSQKASTHIASLILEVQKDTEQAVKAINKSSIDVQNGTTAVDNAGTSFKDITELVDRVSQQIKEISSSIQGMAKGSQQIVSSVEQIDSLSKNTSADTHSVSAAIEEQTASMEQVASSSQSLAVLAQNLHERVAKFKF